LKSALGALRLRKESLALDPDSETSQHRLEEPEKILAQAELDSALEGGT